MIYFGTHLRFDESLLPAFFRTDAYQRNDLFYRHGTLTKNKAWEVQVARWAPSHIFGFEIDLRWRGVSHAGPRLEITLFGLMLDLSIHDARHWDYDNNHWEDGSHADS